MLTLQESTPELRLAASGPVAFVLDADRTLAPVDTGREVGRAFGLNTRIRSVFEEHGYTPEAFREHARIWSELAPEDLDAEAHRVAKTINLYEVWRDLLRPARRVPAVVVTAGLPQVWRRALALAGLGHVPVLGGLHQQLDPYYVTPSCKAWVVRALQGVGIRVVAAGDSEIDLDMLKAADVPLWVPDPKGSPRLFARLHEVPRVRQVAVDHRRFPPHPVLDGAALAALLSEAS